jgi:hypothetical protein
MKRTAIFSMPYGRDNAINIWGDYTHLVEYLTHDIATHSTSRVWQLRGRKMGDGTYVRPRSLTDEEVSQILGNLFIQNAVREFPLPVRKSWGRRFREWVGGRLGLIRF